MIINLPVNIFTYIVDPFLSLFLLAFCTFFFKLIETSSQCAQCTKRAQWPFVHFGRLQHNARNEECMKLQIKTVHSGLIMSAIAFSITHGVLLKHSSEIHDITVRNDGIHIIFSARSLIHRQTLSITLTSQTYKMPKGTERHGFIFSTNNSSMDFPSSHCCCYSHLVNAEYLTQMSLKNRGFSSSQIASSRCRLF